MIERLQSSFYFVENTSNREMKFVIILAFCLCSSASANFLFNNPFYHLARDVVGNISSIVAPNLLPVFNAAFDNFNKNFHKNDFAQHINNQTMELAKMFFARTWTMVEEHNKRFVSGLSTYSQGIYAFADQDPKKVLTQLCGAKTPPTPRSLPQAKPTSFRPGLPAWDWTPYMLEVKNQRSCGSCWAFSTISMLEAQFKIRNPANYNIKLSPQFLVDCSRGGNDGCK
jgi:Papain family cysteine protease